MPKNIHKSIHVFLSKLKRTNQNNQHDHSSPSLVNSSPKNWILSGCKHSRTLSFAIDKIPSSSSASATKSCEDGAATLSDIDRFLFENFNSLYRNENDNNNLVVDEKSTKMRKNKNKNKKKKKNEDSRRDNGNIDFLFESPRLMYPPPDNIRASSRFFVSPGTSGSLVEENRSSSGGSISTFDDIGSSTSIAHHTCTTPSYQSIEAENGTNHNLPEDSVAVLRNSPNPYDDFRRSMQEMIEARLDQNQSVDWDFMEELLFCYLKLNEKKSYKYILGAFVDLIVNLRQNNKGKSQTRSSSRKVSIKRKEIKKIVKKKDCVT
ncbi:hypothetical protein MKX01_000280 [Papaver californicum]|nr:hypothetical protein MKX01_000280 [Papaver californicum]